MRTAAVAFVAALLAAAAFTPVVRALAHRFGALDAVGARKIHARPIPRLGGVAIVLAFFVPLVALLFVDSGVGARFVQFPLRTAGLFLGGLAIAALGVYDDLKGANAKTKFLVQFAVAGAMYALNYRIDQIALPFGEPIELGWLGLPFTMLWIAGIINALNLIDGLDGLAGGVAFVAITTIFGIAAFQGSPLMTLFAAALGGAVLGFLFYNFNPASIFMGDTGSMFLGFVLAVTSIQIDHQSSTAGVEMLVAILVLGVPIVDTLLAMTRRAARGVPMFSADRGHIHHRLLDLGLSQRQTVLVIYGASSALGAAAVALAFAPPLHALWLVSGLVLLSFLGLRRLGFFHLGAARRLLEDRKRNLEMQGAVRKAGAAMRDARSVDDLWVALRFAAWGLGASAVALRLPRPDATGREPLDHGFDEELDLLVARFALVQDRPGARPEARLGDAHLELGWGDGRTAVDRDTEIAVEMLCEQASGALARVSVPPRRSALRLVRDGPRAAAGG